MADRTKDRTKAVVERAAAKTPVESPNEATGEITAPLSADEIAAELADRPVGGKRGADGGSAATQVMPLPAGANSATQVLPVPADANGATQVLPVPGADQAPAEDPADEPETGAEPDAGADLDAAAEPDPVQDAEAPDDHFPVPERHSGDKIAGRYRLEERISQSTAFSSWRAVDEKLRRAVGVHLLAAGSKRAEGVLAAARSAALLGDPRFVQVLDAVQEGELVYVIREWLPDATDLATLLAPGPMEPYDAYQMARQLTDAIAAAHRSGRSHLRLTPRCVLRTDTGQYRINGVAVDAALRGLPDQDAELTDTRAIGTLLYAALTHHWPHPENRYGLPGLPEGGTLAPPEQLRPEVHQGLAELAVRVLSDPPPRGLTPITSPAALAKEIALLPKIRQPAPEQPGPERTAPRYPAPPRPDNRTQVLRTVPPGGHRPAPAPFAPPPAPVAPAPRPGRRRAKRVLQWTVSVVLLAAIGYGSWELAGRLGTTTQKQALGTTGGAGVVSSASPSAKPVTALQISQIQSFNPFGSGPMHPELISEINSGSPNGAWQTQGYYSDLPTIGHGTGLLVDLGSAKSVSSVEVQFLGTTSAELRVPSATGGSAPTTLDDFGQPLAKASGTDAQFQLTSPVTSRYLLIWLTSLPKDRDGSYRGQVSEIKVSG